MGALIVCGPDHLKRWQCETLEAESMQILFVFLNRAGKSCEVNYFPSQARR